MLTKKPTKYELIEALADNEIALTELKQAMNLDTERLSSLRARRKQIIDKIISMKDPNNEV